MENETSVHQNKVRRLGNVLLAVACFGLIASILLVPLGISLSSPSEGGEFDQLVDELSLPAGITGDTKVRELLRMDREFFEENASTYRLLTILEAAIYAIVALVCIRIALAWRRAETFGRATIVGLRCLGLLFLVQSVGGWLVSNFVPLAKHTEVLFFSEIYRIPIDNLGGGSASLSCGILFLTMSWVLDYGRRIKEEQALTV